jgi:hypothetical protein
MKKVTISIPVRSIWSTIIALAIAAFAYLQAVIYIIPGIKKILELTSQNTDIQSIELMWAPIIGYIIIVSFVCMVLRIFKKLKPHKQKGLITELIDWLKLGLIIGLIFGLIIGLIIGLIFGLIFGLTAGLIFGLTAGLTTGLIFGLIAGLIGEFKKEKVED